MSADIAKAAAAHVAAHRVQSGMIVGLGTGTTARFFVQSLAARIASGDLSNVRGVATSRASEALAQSGGIALVPLTQATRPDVTIDGADEIDANFHLIKGGGGALVREKLVAAASSEMMVIADTSKNVPVLGTFRLPVAVFPFGWEVTQARLEAAFPGASAQLRGEANTPFVTDDHLFILDCALGPIPDPPQTLLALRAIPGVAEVGLFVGLASRVLFGHDDGTVTEAVNPANRANC